MPLIIEMVKNLLLYVIHMVERLKSPSSQSTIRTPLPFPFWVRTFEMPLASIPKLRTVYPGLTLMETKA